ncbi:MAG TPA: hypothetical protein VGG48_17185 [Rhizomicrobium sp.]|jgi:hypothetical protein
MAASSAKFFGTAAIIGGALRAANSFAPAFLSAPQLVLSYAATDIALLIALVGLWRITGPSLSWNGAYSIMLAGIGLVIIRVSALYDSTFYIFGAAITVISMANVASSMLWRHEPSTLAAWLWLAAFGFGMSVILFSWGFLAAGIAFGLGFVAQGVVMWRG